MIRTILHSPLRRTAAFVSLSPLWLAGCLAPINGGKPAAQAPSPTREASADLAAFTPEWAYDAPAYGKPGDEPNPEARADARAPLHFYLNRRLLHIRRPAAQDAGETPRVAILATTDNGASWRRIGYFGRGQTFFPFEVAADGDYGIRFTVPSEGPMREPAAAAQRVYHVDATPPVVGLTLEPAAGSYAVGQTLTVGWSATDRQLLEHPAQVSVAGDSQDWRVLAPDQSAEGSLAYVIPDSARGHALQFRVEALDRAGNSGLAFSPTLLISGGEKPTETTAETTAANIEPPCNPAAQPRATDEATPPALLARADADPQPCPDDPNPCPDEAALAYAAPPREAPASAPAEPQEVHTVAAAADAPPEHGDAALDDHRVSVATDVLSFLPEGRIAVPGFRAPLVPPLPALESAAHAATERDTPADDRPWQVLVRGAATCGEVVWSLPKPRFLTQLSRFVEMQWRQAQQTDFVAAPAPVANDPAVARAGSATDSPADDPARP